MKNVLLTIPVFVKLEVMGASLDWSRATFTMDPEHSKAVAEAFKRLYDKGEFASHSFYFLFYPHPHDRFAGKIAKSSVLSKLLGMN